MSYPTARNQKPLRRSPARPGPYDGDYQEVPFEQAFYDQAPYGEARYYQTPYDEVRYDDGAYHDAPYQRAYYDQAPYGQDPYEYGQGRYHEALYQDSGREEAPYHDALTGETLLDGGYERRASGRRKPGAHRHSKPSKMRRKPVRIAAVMAGSTLLVAAAAPAAAHWWHHPSAHPDALGRSSPLNTPAAPLGADAQTPTQTAASHNALDQWAQIPVGKHTAAKIVAVRRAEAKRRRAAQSAATSSSAYQNPLRAVSDLVLERVDMGVDFGGAGPVYALGDGVITNATADSPGWPGGGWITYQLTDGPDAGLVVYVAEDVTPTVEVGQKVTSSTVIANMFNGGDGIETGWATSDGSTAESQMAAAGGISGGGPFPTMVGLSFDAVLESVGVPAAPNASEPGNGLLPAGYPPA